VQYVLSRIPIDAEGYKQTHTTRDVFIIWTGTAASSTSQLRRVDL